jgi:hypothetical protein
MLRRRLAAPAAALAAATAAALLATAGPASADVPGSGFIYRITTSSALAVDVSGASQDWGAPVIDWYVNGHSNQSWELVSVGNTPNEFQIVNENSGLCLAINAASTGLYDGASIIQFKCLGNAPTEQWIFQPHYLGNGSGNENYYTIASAADTGYVLDVPADNTVPGTALEIWGANGGLSQQFYIVELDIA